MAKQTKITIEIDSLLILRRGNSTRAWCPRCAAEGEMIALEKTGSDLQPAETAPGRMAQFGGSAPVGSGRRLPSDLPEFTAGSRTEHKNALAAEWRGGEIREKEMT